MGKPGDRHRSWRPEANFAVRAGTALVTPWVYQGTSLRCSLPEFAAGDVQSARNRDEEFVDEAKSAGFGSARPGRTCAAGIGGNEQEFLSSGEVETNERIC